MRSIILIFISFSFGFVIGTIPMQSSVFPAYSQWITNKKGATDSVQLNQSSRQQPSEESILPEPGTLEENQMVDRFTFYPLHFLEKTIEAKRKLIEDTQVRSFFTLAKEDGTGASGNSSDSKKYINKIHATSFDARVYKAKSSLQIGSNHFVAYYFFSFKLQDGKYCWNLSGLYDLVETKQRFSRENCSNYNDFGKYQDEPFALIPVSERGVRDFLSYLALPVPVLQAEPAKLLSLETETGLWKEESLIEWTVAQKSEKDRFDSTGAYTP